MRNIAKICAWIFGGLFALVLIFCCAVYLFISSDYFRSLAENRANGSTGRKTEIGKIEVAWGRVSHVRLTDVSLSNVDWGKAPHMFEAGVIDFDLSLWPLLRGHVDIPQLTIERPKVALERNAKGQSNWSFQESPVAASAVDTVTPNERSNAPIIGSLQIRDGKIGFTDQQRHLSLEGTVNIASGAAAEAEQVHLAMKGAIEDKPLSLSFTGGSVLLLRNGSAPYPLSLKIDFGATKLALSGKIADPFKFEGADVKLHLQGPDLAEVFPLLGVPAPPTPPYELAGNLERTGDSWKVTNLAGTIGKSDIAGAISIERRGKKSYLRADLISTNLNFDDLGPLVGIPPNTKKGDVASTQQKQEKQNLDQQQNLFPDTPLHVELLREMDMDVSLDAKHVTAAPYLPVKAMLGHVKIKDGNAVLDPLKLAVAGGTVTGSMGVDSRPDSPVVTAKLGFRDLDLKEFFRTSKYFTTTNGKVLGYIDLKGNGHSLAKVFGSADGEGGLAMTGGSISGLLIDLAGLDIGHALILYITEDQRLPIRCAMGRLAFRNGSVVFDKTMMDTTRSVLHIDGQTNLTSQQINMKIQADAKKFSLLDLEAPVLFQGKLREPDISIGKKVPIPLIELGGARDLDCGSQIKAALPGLQQVNE
ncbi:MAG TPA: AsmA family protein [Dongiaceae bacterium]|nr:AsmA family protein [Dongiaceae bacterium]